ncbi:MAG: cytochrome c biogenesis protein CcsA [Verrucomicrobiota bacterium]
MDKIYLGIATAFFLGGFIYSVIALKNGSFRPSRYNLAAMLGGLVFQTLFLGDRGRIHYACPVTTAAEMFVFIAWAMVIIYLVLGPTYRLSLLGVFTSPLVFFFQVPALLAGFDKVAAEAVADAKGPTNAWLETHIALALIAYGAFAMAFVAGIMFLVQDRFLKKGKLNGLFFHLPPIQNLSRAILLLVILGVALLAGALGSAYAIDGAAGTAKLFIMHGMWVLYAVLLGVRFTRGLPSAQFARFTILAFAVPMVSLYFVR